MTKRTQQYQLDPNVEELEGVGVHETVIETLNKYDALYDPTLQRLINSGIVVAAEGAISWREGHLQHVARLYVSDPALAWRDYADDLTVALAADGSNFAALVERARGE